MKTMALVRHATLPAALVAGLLAAAPGFAGDEKKARAPDFAQAALRRAAARAAPAVVRLRVDRYARTLESEANERRGRRIARRLGPRFLARYFRRPTGPATGVLVAPEGLVLTSKFNVEGLVRSVHVELGDGRLFPARVLGWDANLDLAAVKIDPAGETLPALRLAAGPPPPVGSLIAVVGAAWGRVPYTMNAGLVSAHGRLGGRALQLCVHLNYANTGGAVVDLEGRLIGIAGHVRPFNRTGLNSGVGFCTPAAKVAAVLADLANGQRVEDRSRPFLGIGMSADEKGKAVYLSEVYPGSGAENAGLQVGDLLVSLAGTPIQEASDVRLALARCRVGQVIAVEIVRAGKKMRLEATLGARQ